MRVGNERVGNFCKQLMLFASSPNVARNEKEIGLIALLEDQLQRVADGRPLEVSKLEKIHHKVSRVQCFGERYMQIVNFLDEYRAGYELKKGL